MNKEIIEGLIIGLNVTIENLSGDLYNDDIAGMIEKIKDIETIINDMKNEIGSK